MNLINSSGSSNRSGNHNRMAVAIVAEEIKDQIK